MANCIQMSQLEQAVVLLHPAAVRLESVRAQSCRWAALFGANQRREAVVVERAEFGYLPLVSPQEQLEKATVLAS